MVLAKASYNAHSGLLICCPTTTKVKDYPFEVRLLGEPSSVALVDRVRSLNWQARGARPKRRVAQEEFADIRSKPAALIL